MNNTEKKNAWYNETILPKEMVSKVISHENGWSKLEHSDHFRFLDELINLTESKTIADIGCGAAELGRIYNNFNYTGFDLPHIIEKVSKVVNPNLNYQVFDAYNFDYTFCKILSCNINNEVYDEKNVVQNDRIHQIDVNAIRNAIKSAVSNKKKNTDIKKIKVSDSIKYSTSTSKKDTPLKHRIQIKKKA